jgi:hypothetical protein
VSDGALIGKARETWRGLERLAGETEMLLGRGAPVA